MTAPQPDRPRSQHIPDAQLAVCPDAGHGSQFQYPERFLGHLSQFLDE